MSNSIKDPSASPRSEHNRRSCSEVNTTASNAKPPNSHLAPLGNGPAFFPSQDVWSNPANPIALYSGNYRMGTNPSAADFMAQQQQQQYYQASLGGGYHQTFELTHQQGQTGWPGQPHFNYGPVPQQSNSYANPPAAAPYHHMHHPPPTAFQQQQPYGTSFFDYAQNWSPSMIPHGNSAEVNNSGSKSSVQQHDYYRTPGYALLDDRVQQHYAPAPAPTSNRLGQQQQQQMAQNNQLPDLAQLAVSSPPRIDHHQLHGFGPVTGHHLPVSTAPSLMPPKPISWADKVKQAPKETIAKEKVRRVPIGGVAGAMQQMKGSPPSCQAPLSVVHHWTADDKTDRPLTDDNTAQNWTSSTRTRAEISSEQQNGEMVGEDCHQTSNGMTGRQAKKNTVTSAGGNTLERGDSAVGQEDWQVNIQRLKGETNARELTVGVKNARFFVIKSYAEDDVHRSIKYGIWCSTEHGNKRLDNAFKERHNKGPIYLFFSVNASGHFCGIAQMMSAVDYDQQSGVWAQDKWKGLFKVKWLYVKDVPNQHLRSIRLENNENKPVTNSRDTQEVPFEKGKLLIKMVHDYKHSTSLFDDFSHYEQRQQDEARNKSSR